jgi:hypothetical protein
MDNKSKSDRIHELLPRLLGSKQDSNWSALVAAVGAEDDRLASLIAEVRDQFFVKTASRPYLDRLAANSNISRPKFIGIGDTDFRKYVPVLSYQPKQVKSIVETLLDLFFFKEATTAFLSSTAYEPFTLRDGWSLALTVDNLNQESVRFSAADFSSISSATADEVAAAYNRQAKFSYATNFFDSVTKRNYIRIFTNTTGTQGSLEITGGLANIGLQLNGFISAAGLGANTQWSVNKVGDSVTFTHTGGALPGLDKLEAGDIYLCDLTGNEGSFSIATVDVQTSSFTFTNLFATTGSVTQTSASQSKFLRPEKITSYRGSRRALAWETQVGKVTVEMPATPSVVQRGVRGGFHINGTTSLTSSITNATTLVVEDASAFPASGQFVLEPVNGVTARLVTPTSDEVVTYSSNGRTIFPLTRYSYSSIAGNSLMGISPDLPTTTALNEVELAFIARNSNVVTCSGNNDFKVGELVTIRNSTGFDLLASFGNITTGSAALTDIGDMTGVAPGQMVRGTGIPSNTYVTSITGPTSLLMSNNATDTNLIFLTFSENINGSFEIASVDTESAFFTFNHLGIDGFASIAGIASVERIQLDSANSKVILTTARPAEETELVGPYVWDIHAPYVLSSHTATTMSGITAGKPIKLLEISANTIPDESGYVMFDYGQNNQEGPIRYLYKPASTILALDPSYTFQQNHASGCSVVALSHKGPHIISGMGSEYPPYLTNPSAARLILQELIKDVTSAGIFIDFLVRYPTQLYGTISVYD